MHLDLLCGINVSNKILEKDKVVFPETTVLGALSKYISTSNEKFQPMNANFGILPALGVKIKDKKQRYEKLADRSISNLENITNITKILQID